MRRASPLTEEGFRSGWRNLPKWDRTRANWRYCPPGVGLIQSANATSRKHVVRRSTQQEILDADKLEVPGNRRGKVKRQGGRDRLGWTEGRGTGTPAEPVTSDVSLQSDWAGINFEVWNPPMRLWWGVGRAGIGGGRGRMGSDFRQGSIPVNCEVKSQGGCKESMEHQRLQKKKKKRKEDP